MIELTGFEVVMSVVSIVAPALFVGFLLGKCLARYMQKKALTKRAKGKEQSGYLSMV